MNDENRKEPRPLWQRVLAGAAAALLALLALGALVAALAGAPGNVILALLFAGVILSVTIYAFLLITRQIRKKKDG